MMSLHRLLLFLAVILFIRYLAFALTYPNNPSQIYTNDSYEYLHSASTLRDTQQFLISPSDLRPQTDRLPGYPLFLALILGIFPGQIHAVILAQMLIHTVTAALTYSIARHLFPSPAIAALSAAIYVLDPLSCLGAQLVLAETLFTFFLAASVLFALKFFKSGTGIFFSGLCLVSATMVRPDSYYLFLPATAFLFLFLVHKGGPAKAALICLLFLSSAVLIMGSWHWRNYHTAQTTEFSTLIPRNAYLYRAGGVMARRDKIPLAESIAKLQLELDNNNLHHGQYEFMRKKSATLIQEDWPLFLRDEIEGIYRIMTGTGSGEVRKLYGLKNRVINKLLEQYGNLHYLLLLGGLVMALFLPFSHRQFLAPSAHLYTCLLIAYLLLVSAGPGAYSRFRIPLMPYLSIYAGAGLISARALFLSRISRLLEK